MSFPCGVLATVYFVYLLGHKQNPSWCFVVIFTYFTPAFFAICAHFLALNFSGFHWFINCNHSLVGTFAHDLSHSAAPRYVFPFHSPPGMAYSPQWMNAPRRFSLNFCMKTSRRFPNRSAPYFKLISSSEGSLFSCACIVWTLNNKAVRMWIKYCFFIFLVFWVIVLFDKFSLFGFWTLWYGCLWIWTLHYSLDYP